MNPAAAAENIGKKLTINPNGAFIDTSGSVEITLSVRGDYVRLGNVEAAAFILAHEMGHRTNKLIVDGNDPLGVLSISNNGTIYEACFSGVPYVKGH